MSDSLSATLAAERAIRRLVSLYCDAVARRDADSIADLFTPDARVTIAHLPERVGREEIVEGLRRTMTAFTFLHQKCDTGLIDVEGDSARMRMCVTESNRAVGTDSLNTIFGFYEDEFKLIDEGWRFHRRRFTMQARVVVPASEMQEFPELVPAFAFAP